MDNEQEQNIVKFFTQSPNIILYGLPGIAIRDKWALISLVGMCRNGCKGDTTLKELEGPYKLSLREIEALTGIQQSALRKTAGKNPREGVLDRLQSLGYITLLEGKPINEITRKEGRPQTYLYIHLEKLWCDNLTFSESWRMPSNTLVDTDTFTTTADGTVHQTDGDVHPVTTTVHHADNNVHDETTTVHHADNNVHDETTTVHYTDSDGHRVNHTADSNGHVMNHTVHSRSTKSALIHNYTDNTIKDDNNTNLNDQQQTQLSLSPTQSQQQLESKGAQSQNRPCKASTSRDIVLTRLGEHILDLYDDFKGRKAVRNEAMLLAANRLGEVVGSDEDFLAVLRAIANDPFLEHKQVRTDLDFVYHKYDGFLDIVEQARGRQPPGASGGKTDYNAVVGMTDEQRAAYKRAQ
jgi:hypothetical protein